MAADGYNKSEWDRGNISPTHLTELTKFFQENTPGLKVDGYLGPNTRAALEKLDCLVPAPVQSIDLGALPPLKVVDGWLTGQGVTKMAIHGSWYYSFPATKPIGIVAHYTATDPGTAVNMAKRRQRPRASGDRAASWHISIEADGSIVQMVPANRGAWHARATPESAALGVRSPNRQAVGIELVGHGQEFPGPQVIAAARVWKALVAAYDIERKLAMLQHSKLDPSRRKDPGPVWMNNYAELVLDYAF